MRNLIYIIISVALAILCLYSLFDFIIAENETIRNVFTAVVSFLSMMVTSLEIDIFDWR